MKKEIEDCLITPIKVETYGDFIKVESITNEKDKLLLKEDVNTKILKTRNEAIAWTIGGKNIEEETCLYLVVSKEWDNYEVLDVKANEKKAREKVIRLSNKNSKEFRIERVASELFKHDVKYEMPPTNRICMELNDKYEVKNVLNACNEERPSLKEFRRFWTTRGIFSFFIKKKEEKKEVEEVKETFNF